MLDYKFDKDSAYIVACTYGPDSMALVDMLQKEGVRPIVAAVNYNKFRSSGEGFAALGEYCKQRGLTYEYLDCAALPEEEQYHEGQDFAAWARKIRYGFFHQVYDKYNAAALLLAHHQDDLIEAYINQKERKMSESKYDFSPVSTYEGMIIVRPLLDFSREDLLEYNDENHVPYSLEEDRFENDFTRSKLRKEVIAHLSEIERDQLIQEMKFHNDDQLKLVDEVEETISQGEELDIRAVISLTASEFALVLTRFIQNVSAKVKITPAMLTKIRAFMLNEKLTDTFKIEEGLYLIKEYDHITIGQNFDELPYTYVLEAPGVLHTEQFDLDFSMGAEDRNIHESDYPITIRTAIPSDAYVCNYYLQPVRTLFSVWEMPVRLRYVWPVFVNKNGKIIYVPRYRVNFSEYHTSVLKIHLKEGER